MSSNRGRAAFLSVKETPPGRIFQPIRPERTAFGGQSMMPKSAKRFSDHIMLERKEPRSQNAIDPPSGS
jgi:hypothetical protein